MSNAIILPISGWLSNVIGRKRFYMICVGLFTVSSVACGLSDSLGMMLFFRVLQGIGGGGLAPTEQSIFADSFTPQKRALAFAVYGFTVVTAPAIGPVLGGWLTDNYSWHWVFLINLPVGLLSLTLTFLFVHDSPALKKDRAKLLAKGLKIDYFGFLLVAVGFGCLQIVLDRFEREDGFSSPFIRYFAAASAIGLIGMVIWELFHDQPIVNLRLYKIRAFAISNIVMFIFGFIIISTTQLLPQLSQELLHYDATTAGLTLGLGGLVSVFVMPIAGIVTGKIIQPRWLIFSALLGTAGALNYASRSRYHHLVLEHLPFPGTAGHLAAVHLHPDLVGVVYRRAARQERRRFGAREPDAQPGRKLGRVGRHDRTAVEHADPYRTARRARHAL